MPVAHCVVSTPVERTARVLQLSGLFELPPCRRSEERFEVNLPLEDGPPWAIGLIVGPSGSGKTTVARELWPAHLVSGHDWPASRSLVDGFPAGLSIKEITGLLSSVGFSSPPSWLRPFRVLSNGEQFRATIARALAESPGLLVLDEFTSVVDRQVARIASAAVAKAVRRRKQQFIAVSCHEDIVDWLAPDWVLEMPLGTFTRRSLRPRPALRLEIRRVHRNAWRLFERAHYLNGELHQSARCFVGFIGDTPAAFTAVLFFPHPKRPGWREHRTVCLPDFQGIGIGNGISEAVASFFAATGKPYRSVTSNPAMVRHRARSPLWQMSRKPGMAMPHKGLRDSLGAGSCGRITASFMYCGPPDLEAARGFGLIQ